jgi:hypothetical protein
MNRRIRQRNQILRAPRPSPLSPAARSEMALIARRVQTRNSERKYSYQGTVTTATNAFVFTSMTDISQAVSDTDRVGDVLELSGNIDVRYSIEKNAASTVLFEHVRLVILQWHLSDVTTPPTGALCFLQDPSVSAISYRSQESHDLGKFGANPQFRIIYDHTTTLVGTNLLPTESLSAYVTTSVSIATIKKRIQYISGGNNGTNKLFLGIIGSSATNVPSVNFTAMILYTDS